MSFREGLKMLTARLLLTALLALACLRAADSLAAQRAERPSIKVGDQWRFAVYYTVPSTEPTRVWTITSVSATAIEGTENGEPLMLTADLNVLESPRDKQSNPKSLDFPLVVGKQWRYTTDWLFKPKGASGSIAVEVVVNAYETVTVPAGEFEAFMLTSRERLSGTSPINSQYAGEITRTYWYAPAAHAIVKMVSHNPYLGRSTVELVAFELQR
jgi:hypothetical protein